MAFQRKGRLSRSRPKLQSRWKGFRQYLLAFHGDLFLIDEKVRSVSDACLPELTNLEKMVVVLEDRRFFDHLGVDLFSVVRELVRFATFRRHGGASTIDMQLVRTVTGYRERTLKRKLYECLLALVMQRRYSKPRILRGYIACAYYGTRLIGAIRASEKIYQVSPAALDARQASFIAAMLARPRPASAPSEWLSRVQRRADYGHSIYIRHKNRFDKLPG